MSRLRTWWTRRPALATAMTVALLVLVTVAQALVGLAVARRVQATHAAPPAPALPVAAAPAPAAEEHAPARPPISLSRPHNPRSTILGPVSDGDGGVVYK
jgi:hypothetical protein